MNYEQTLFQIAPWTQEIMQIAKQLNNGNLLKGRTGWIRRSVTNPESIYEHSCKVALAAWYLYKTDDAIATGAVHDFPEIFEEDYIPWEINSKDKKEKEYAAMTKLKNILPNGNYWFNAQEEFENARTNGKHLIELDKICPAIQAIDYMRAGNGNGLEEFYPYARKKVKTPQLLELLDEICLNPPKNKSAYEVYFKELEKIRL